MKEMLLVGRGGEGVVLASQILAETFARAGFWVQDIVYVLNDNEAYMNTGVQTTSAGS